MKHLTVSPLPRLLGAAFIGFVTLGALTAPAAESAGLVAYNRDIRPILAENCFACHGPDSAARKASLRLDSFQAATAERKDSKPAIVPGKPDESSVIARILTTDEDDVMPPAKTKKVLKPEEKELLRRWVAEGAKYEAHWSFIPPVKAAPPADDTGWVKSPIDAFVLARVKSMGLEPAPEADRTTLARRLSLDLTGLPPSPELVQSFVNDPSPGAYEALVDKLLASQRYGEHRARYWLDAARYADTHGIHFDNFREMWSYREWVINAFNDNMKFDQFTIEQLAGDLMPKPSLEQRIATGFNRCNMTTSEGGAINEEYLVHYARDRTETTAAVWMGLTANCATCHDHKFDPLTQKEFYSLSAFFNNTTQPAMDGNRRDTPPIVVVPTRQDRSRWEELPGVMTAAKQRIDSRRQAAVDDFSAWLKKSEPAKILEGVPTEGLAFSAPLKESTQPAVTVLVGGYPRTLPLGTAKEGVVGAYAFVTDKELTPSIPEAGDFERDQSFTASLWVKLSNDDKSGSIISRMDEDDAYRGWDLWFEDGKPGMHLVNKWPDDALKVVARRAIEIGKWVHVAISYNGSSKAEGVTIYIDGKAQEVNRTADKLASTIKSKAPFKIGQRKKGDHLEKAGVQDVRLYTRKLAAGDVLALKDKPRLAWLVAKSNRTTEDDKQLYDTYLSGFDTEYRAGSQALAALEQEEREIKTRGTVAHVMQEKDSAAEAYVLFRGEYDKRRDKVGPGTPQFLPALAEDAPPNRLSFAKWLLRPDHPLTARVTVNRMWQELFGTGLVRTAGDFGVTGESPSHPELLDWLAVDFRENGWDMKRVYKLMVMSATYRQASFATPEKIAKDPQNLFLARGPRFRMDAEMVRDYALAASGLLSPTIGGPSVRPYQPEGVWEMVAMPESDTRNYRRDEGEKLYRRSMYTFWKRGAPPASMDVMNAPSREVCTVRRERTNTPLQALATLNDTQFIEAARHLAEIALRDGGSSDSQRLDFIAQRILARPFRDQERMVVQGVLDDLRAHYGKAGEDAKTLISVGETKADEKLEPVLLASYTMVVNQLMNLDEVLNK